MVKDLQRNKELGVGLNELMVWMSMAYERERERERTYWSTDFACTRRTPLLLITGSGRDGMILSYNILAVVFPMEYYSKFNT